MIYTYSLSSDGLLCSTLDEGAVLPPSTVWLDLVHPTPAEEREAQRQLGIELPTREEMQEIEASSRLYEENNAVVMTVPVLNKATTEHPESTAITFIVLPHILLTLRYADPKPFAVYTRRAMRQPVQAATAEAVLLGLLEAIADRLADILEQAALDLEKVSFQIFAGPDAAKESDADLQDILCQIGRSGDLGTKARESLLGLSRAVIFLNTHATPSKEGKNRINTLSRDVASISDHASFMAGKVNFLLDATLGLINIEQNRIIKIFSVAAVAFLPPTLVASLYGMNFKHFPELEWEWGYPFALVLMLLSALVPFAYFRRRKWL